MRLRTRIACTVAALTVVVAGGLVSATITSASAAAPSGGITPSVVGGRPATENYPLASLGGCTGSLIAPGWILTAAHCHELFQYRVGNVDYTKARVIDGGAWGIRHPKADVMLIPINPQKDLPTLGIAKFAPSTGQKIRMVGWGITCPKLGCGEAPTIANELDTTMIPDSKCVNKDVPIKNDVEMCVDSPGRKAGACFGDSGGPLLKKVDGNKWVIVGVTSRPGDGGDTCAVAPAIYTDVTAPAVRDWIVKTTGIA